MSTPMSFADTAPKKNFSLWREELKRAWGELRGPGTTPGRAAASVALGLFVGSLPIFGCHTLLVLALCVYFQLDAAVAWAVSNVSNPFFAPALLTAEVQIGAWLCTGAPLRLDLTRTGAMRHFIGYLCLGSPLAGLVLALFGGATTYAVASLLPKRSTRCPYRLPTDAPPWVKAVERVATRFASPLGSTYRERTVFHYARTKLLGDPVAKLVANLASDEPSGFGTLLDIGTGRGQLPLLLIELGLASSARGFDWDRGKIADAQRAAEGNGSPPVDATFSECDMRATAFEPADTVLLIDVLHYVSISEQNAILDRAAAAVRPGGRLLVREADSKRGWRSLLTLAEECIFTLARVNRGERLRFRSAEEIARRVEAGGLGCTIRPAWGRTPFSNVLVVGRRPR
jgi:uncharacterized protein (DUF2062 family)/2-polyprenyl-3-methyl-5-hydroxy-6-metoxy-1,4-benzoquinol methylase